MSHLQAAEAHLGLAKIILILIVSEYLAALNSTDDDVM